ncbi:MbeD/MobD family mobilization/exclusion protein [Allorhizobium sp. NPDC080224]|uniref:Uncharacterized protein n=2 Tax=Alphaproteobacteria TaxID=28211 RepID=A0A512HKP2_9HYPH|nr:MULTISPECIES: MbeD/MobD family mobilization/exclusion protein [Alphaproteobacteria]NTE55337.1 hypothetical protein [Agrobacterium tumefaciens]NTE72759.1 hypothetical protein [Agrobacterium tumefaciens]GEO86019.1 hypothetical protein RNA01_29510 [Ciceribacter naphthalenivorans]GLR23526.1 hypothetical protein GCM10007920_33170 [Ciceribacter naphthalenivorans]GLT06382.1 hypothetical protein GCM10007926_33170 [Sphingomonas psychrolutea]
MKLRLSATGLALVAQTALFSAPAVLAQETPTQTALASQDDPSLARQALEWSQDQLAELDATIAVLEKEAAKLQDVARTRAEEALKTLRDRRDAYRIQAEESVANARTWTDAQVAEARKSLDDNWVAFQTTRDEYLETAKADLATRRAVLEAELEARRKAWQTALDELRADAEKLAADQRASIDARIAALNAQVDEASARIARLQDASAEAWEKTKQGYADTQKVFLDTYASIRKSIRDATK